MCISRVSRVILMIVAYGDAYQNSHNIIRFACNLLDNDRLIF